MKGIRMYLEVHFANLNMDALITKFMIGIMIIG